MTIQIARRIGAALNVKSGTKIAALDQALRQYVREVPQSPTTPFSGSIDASQVISGTFVDARISESSVTQHEAALEIDAGLQLINTLADARVAQSNVTQHQAALLLAASQINSGTFADARIAQSNVTQHEGALDIDASMQLSNQVPVANGGTGLATLTAAALMIGNGTSSPTFLAPGSAKNVPRSNGSAWLAAQLAMLDISDYAEGTWTPTDGSGAALSLTADGLYTRIGNLVAAQGYVVYPATADTSNNQINGLPFTVSGAASSVRQGFVSYQNLGSHFYPLPSASSTVLNFWTTGGGLYTNAQLSGVTIFFTCLYPKA